MKSILHLLSLVAVPMLFADHPPLQMSTRWLGDRAAMQKKITMIIESHAGELKLIRDGLRAVTQQNASAEMTIINDSLQSLEGIVQRQESEKALALLRLVDVLNEHNSEESPRVMPTIDNSDAQIVLNYLMDGVFMARMLGAADAVGDSEIEAMIRFYAGNSAQTSEGSWRAGNVMLFVFGDRLLNCLESKVPDRIDPFYKAVQAARKSTQSGPGPDEEVIPDSWRLSAEALQKYENFFDKLETLAVKNALPSSGPPSRLSKMQGSVPQHLVPAVQTSAPAAVPEAKRALALTEESKLTMSWRAMVVLTVAAIALCALLLKRRS